MALATVSAMETRLGEALGSLDGHDLVRAQEALEDVSALVLQEARREALVDWDEVTVPAPVRVVVIQAALRVYRNPDGYTGETVGSYSIQYGQAHGSVDLYLSDHEKDIIHSAAVGSGPRNFTGTVRTPSAYTAPDDNITGPVWGL